MKKAGKSSKIFHRNVYMRLDDKKGSKFFAKISPFVSGSRSRKQDQTPRLEILTFCAANPIPIPFPGNVSSTLLRLSCPLPASTVVQLKQQRGKRNILAGVR